MNVLSPNNKNVLRSRFQVFPQNSVRAEVFMQTQVSPPGGHSKEYELNPLTPAYHI